MDFCVHTHLHTEKNSSRMFEGNPTYRMKALQFFFFFQHFHLKTIHSRWKMTRELRCNKWKFQIVVPFFSSCDQHTTQRAFFWCFLSFLFRLLVDCISGFPPSACVIILIRFFLCSLLKTSFFKRQEKRFSSFTVFFEINFRLSVF